MKNRFFSSSVRSIFVSSLVIGLIGITGCNKSKTQWEGTWEFKDPSTEESIQVILSEDGKLYLIPPESFQSFQETKTAYELPFTRISDEAVLSDEYTVTNLAEEMNKQAELAKQSEAKQYLGAMTRAQQAYYIEENKFASTIDDLQMGIPTETENFIYKVVPQDDKAKSILITAEAKDATLKSYAGAVFVNSEDTTQSIVCETNENSTTPPAMPTLEGTEAKCAEGSSPIQ